MSVLFLTPYPLQGESLQGESLSLARRGGIKRGRGL